MALHGSTSFGASALPFLIIEFSGATGTSLYLCWVGSKKFK
jgi:hypothetical protein